MVSFILIRLESSLLADHAQRRTVHQAERTPIRRALYIAEGIISLLYL